MNSFKKQKLEMPKIYVYKENEYTCPNKDCGYICLGKDAAYGEFSMRRQWFDIVCPKCWRYLDTIFFATREEASEFRSKQIVMNLDKDKQLPIIKSKYIELVWCMEDLDSDHAELMYKEVVVWKEQVCNDLKDRIEEINEIVKQKYGTCLKMIKMEGEILKHI